MSALKKQHESFASLLAFALIPISGLAMDVYLPSFPEMAINLNTSEANIKLTLSIYLISYGISQLFVGSLVDSFGRFKINLIAILVFSITSIGIIFAPNVYWIIAYRFIQGIAISIIVVSKRAFFIDVYTGEKRKHYTSLLTVVWATAPILAPFLGGYLQEYYGWRANFYFLAAYGLLLFLLEYVFSGETIQKKQEFSLKSILHVYKMLLSHVDFSVGIVLLGFSYTMVMVFGMTIPFIVEHQYHLTPVTSGYCALISGVAIFMGGLLGKLLMNKPFYQKLFFANLLQLIFALLMLLTAPLNLGLPGLLPFVFGIHLFQGLTYNVYFTYCITKFPAYAGTSSGIASGVCYILFSILSFGIANMLHIRDQYTLSLSYLFCILVIGLLIFFFKPAMLKGVALSYSNT
ncbi:MFS transporter [Sphingobacterium sp. HJSM2_6]|uniref:MFS transporter n=1 Tax=Sphingobacterium sp. HJSM2_6 TaxID=3366264 RepID=UPI003BE6ABE1